MRRGFAVAMGSAIGLLLGELLCRIWLEPPRYDSADLRFIERVIRIDPLLRYRLRSDLDLAWSEGTKRGAWTGRLRTSPAGWRLPRFTSGAGAPLRVAVLGDSSTMGFYVDDAEHYPFVCGTRLAQLRGDRRVETANFGVIGYTSEQGRRLLARTLAEESFEFVVLAFGYNDAFLTRRDEADWLAAVPGPNWTELHELLTPRSSLYRMLWSGFHPERQHAFLRPRIPPARFEENLRAMIRLSRRHGARPLVLDLAVPHAFLRERMRAIAAEEDALHLCCAEVFERAVLARGAAGALPQRLQSTGEARLRFRCRGWLDPVLVAFDLARAERTALVLPGNDEGTAGDERPGDGVATWELRVPGNALTYEFAFVERERITAQPEDLNYLFYRRLELEAGQGFDGPVFDPESWRRGWEAWLLDREFVHPSPAGLALLAEELAQAIAAAAGS